jgi:hypothetical protein
MSNQARMKIFRKESVDTLNKWQNWTLDEANEEKYFKAFTSLLLEEKSELAVELWTLLKEAATENGELSASYSSLTCSHGSLLH